MASERSINLTFVFSCLSDVKALSFTRIVVVLDDEL
jgi:hypothetical protein